MSNIIFDRWLYRLFLAIDANFRLKRKSVSSDKKDPGLSRGWAYFVEEMGYKEHLAKYGNLPQEVFFESSFFLHRHTHDMMLQPSTCTNHNAVNNDMRETRGLASTGIGAIVCARHEFKLPCSVGTLQKGER